MGVVHGLRHIVTHGVAGTLCRPVLLYNFVMATKECECECGMIIGDHPIAIRQHKRCRWVGGSEGG